MLFSENALLPKTGGAEKAPSVAENGRMRKYHKNYKELK